MKKIKLLQELVFGGVTHKAGSIVEVSASLADAMVDCGAATYELESSATSTEKKSRSYSGEAAMYAAACGGTTWINDR